MKESSGDKVARYSEHKDKLDGSGLAGSLIAAAIQIRTSARNLLCRKQIAANKRAKCYGFRGFSSRVFGESVTFCTFVPASPKPSRFHNIISLLLPDNLFPAGSGTCQTRIDAVNPTAPATLPAFVGALRYRNPPLAVANNTGTLISGRNIPAARSAAPRTFYLRLII